MSKNVAILAVFTLALAPRASAQVKAGETSLDLSGNATFGYSDDYTNSLGSDHSIIGAGNADLSGSYYSPNFLFFDIQPFYNQSRLNSSYQSITSASGVNATARIFGGSIYPGSVSYARVYNSSGNFGIPGLTNFTTHGDSDSLALNWGIHRRDLPSLNLSFTEGSNTFSVYGANSQGALHTDTFSVSSAYKVAGFNLSGGYQYGGSRSVTPGFLAAGLPERTNSTANSYSFGVAHSLPWHGGFSLSTSRFDLNTGLGDSTSTDKYDTSIDTLSGTLYFAPLAHLNVGETTFYTDNLEGTIYNTLLTAGATVPQSEPQESSHDLSLTSYVNYELPAQHVTLHAFVERQQQTFLGITFASNSYNGTATYSNSLFGGYLNGVLGLTRTSISTTGQSVLGVNSSFNYTHQIQRWTVTGSLGYSQDTQTLLVAYTTSGYTYNGSAGRRIRRRSYWGIYSSGSRSALTNQAGSANSSHTYSTSLSMPKFSVDGSYSTSSGNALLTPTGLVSTPVPVTVINPMDIVLYNGRSYSLGIGSNPTRGMTVSASYAQALSGTQNTGTYSNNSNKNLNFLLIYHFRKLSFTAGYNRLVQGFTATGNPPVLAGSMFVGVSRWFDFF